MSASLAAPAAASGSLGAVGTRSLLGFAFMVLGMFMAILDIQIVSASIADIQAGLAASPDEASWVQTSYLIAEIVMIPLSGYLSRLLSTRVLFTLSAAGFTVFSLACAFATSLPAMVAARTLQGFLGGAMIPTVFATSFLLFPGPARVKATVLIGLMATLAPTIGPTVGGLLTETFSWHWLFLINVPIGALIAVTVWLTMDIDKPDRSLLRRFDLIGLLLMAVFLGSLDYVLEEGARWQWLEDDTIKTFAVVAALAGIGFFWQVLTAAEPIVDLRAYTDRNFAIGALFAFILGIGLYGSVYLVPLFLGRVRGYNSLQIGETMFLTGIGMFVASPIIGQLSRRVDLRVLVAIGLATTGVALWLTARLTTQSGSQQLWFPLLLRGVGMMFVMIPTTTVALGTLPPQRLKNASGLYNLMRNLGGAFGLAMINTMATDRSAAHRLHLAEGVSSGRPSATAAMQNLQDLLGVRLAQPEQADLAALKRMVGLVQQQALVLAYNDVLMAMAALFLLVAPLVFLLAKPRGAGAGPAH
ncbi:DHA2 family efflux MFS transporter permease subunit [Siccirubricoccus sp. KC 17139]|uniref:DHA2 family efflux MFS transporter permease subunit n=1 Tax=Siccirubricoccus soli TaxID=2899147 RepID=A0ABT1D5B6_9PROT|nr:DHA2 family efflux MFS transporter permease subunit [Siccirubricoccus soli]MCO6417101.1 DHA2 family efflux MFS transporter permease subunit [Siccirubricoccus soli]MCP2683236.1 DHA2 family efflux MFS transporter permease subunit [Siccirubricoccus soli]